MGFLIEFLPELISTIKGIKKRLKNPTIFSLFLFSILMIYYYIAIINNLLIALLVMVSCIVCALIYNKDAKALFFIDASLTPQAKPLGFSKLSIELVSGRFTFPIHYKEIVKKVERNLILSSETELIIRVIPKPQANVVIINHEPISSNSIAPLWGLISGAVFEQKVIDSNDDTWLIRVRLWGLFRPRLIILIRPV